MRSRGSTRKMRRKLQDAGLGYRLLIGGMALIIAGGIVFFVLMVRRSNQNAEQDAYDELVDAVTSGYNHEQITTGMPTGSEESGHRVLFLSSYDPTFLTYDDQISGLEEVFDEQGVMLDTLDMETKKHSTQADMEQIEEQVAYRMAQTDYDGIIAADDAALRFVEDHQDEYFKDLPVIFFGVSDTEEGTKAAQDPNITGYLEGDNIEQTLDLALQLLPDTKTVVAIFDNTLTSQVISENYMDLSMEPKYAGLTFASLNFGEFSLDDFCAQVSLLQEGAIIVDVSAFQDGDGINYTVPQSVKAISSAAQVPVFRISKGGFRNGAVAGYVNLFRNTARQAATLMCEILNGEKETKDLALQEQMTACYVVNYTQMQKFHLSMDDLPEGTVILNEPESFLDKYGFIFYPTLLMVAGLLIIVFGLGWEVKERTKAEQDQRRISAELQFSNEHDHLTGIYNRQTALAKIAQDGRLKNGSDYAVMMVDVDDFKELNEKYGHKSGDGLLKSVAWDLQKLAFANNAEVARYGGDEFILLFFDRHLSDDDEIIRQIMALFRKEQPIGIDYVVLHASVGAANSEIGHDANEVLIWAEMALQKAKQQGKNTCTLSTRQMREENRSYEQLKAAILHAIGNDGMYMVYQPQVNTKTGQIVGLEALVRMKDADIGPGTFIPIAEENGWIRSIGRLTTRLVCEQVGKWIATGLSVPPVSINYSAEQLQDLTYVDYLKQQLEANHVPASCIKLEITESLFMDNNQRAEELFKELKDLGIMLLMDDFGTGYSSLNYLSYIPVNVVKIDKTLVDTYMWDNDGIFLRDVIRLVKDLGKSTICEGVETKGQFERLREFGCDCIQGYYFSRPLSADDAFLSMQRGNLFHEDDTPIEEAGDEIRLIES